MMKSSKSKVISNPKKTSKDGEKVRNKKVTPIVSRPSEEEIREKAKEIYLQRIERGEQGTAIDDWHKAEEFLRGS